MVAAINSSNSKLNTLRNKKTELATQYGALEAQRLQAVKERRFDDEKRIRKSKRRLDSQIDSVKVSIRNVSRQISKSQQSGEKKRFAQTEPKPPPVETGVTFSEEGAKRLSEASGRAGSGVKSGQIFRSDNTAYYVGSRRRIDNTTAKRSITTYDLTNKQNIAAIRERQGKGFTVSQLIGDASQSRVKEQAQPRGTTGFYSAAPRRTPTQSFKQGFVTSVTRGVVQPKPLQGRTTLQQGFHQPATSLQTLRAGGIPFEDQVGLTLGVAGRVGTEYTGGYFLGRAGVRGLNLVGSRYGVQGYKAASYAAAGGGVLVGGYATAQTLDTISQGSRDEATLASTRLLVGGGGLLKGFQSVPTGISIKSVSFAKPAQTSGGIKRVSGYPKVASFSSVSTQEGVATINVFGKVQKQPFFISRTTVGQNVGGSNRFALEQTSVSLTRAKLRKGFISMSETSQGKVLSDPKAFLGSTNKGQVFGGELIKRTRLVEGTSLELVDVGFIGKTGAGRRGVAQSVSNTINYNKVSVQPFSNEFIQLTGARRTTLRGNIGFNQASVTKLQEVPRGSLFEAPKTSMFKPPRSPSLWRSRRASIGGSRGTQQTFNFEIQPLRTPTRGRLRNPLSVPLEVGTTFPKGIGRPLLTTAPPRMSFKSEPRRLFSGGSEKASLFSSGRTNFNLLGSSSLLASGTTSKIKTRTTPSQKIIPRATLRNKQIVTSLGGGRSPLTTSFNTPPPPPPTPVGGFPFPAFPLFGSDSSSSTRKRGGRSYKYAPSLTAFFTGAKKTNNKRILTGLEVRGF